jgi:hypothetical protein
MERFQGMDNPQVLQGASDCAPPSERDGSNKGGNPISQATTHTQRKFLWF